MKISSQFSNVLQKFIHRSPATVMVCQMRESVHVAYRNTENISVSITSLYNKLNGMKTDTSAALVRHVAQQSEAIIRDRQRWGIETAFQRLE